MSKIVEYSKLAKELATKLAAITEEDVVAHVRDYLKENGYHGVAWYQYTPSFNDGDPCTFRSGEFYSFDREGLLAYAKENGINPDLLDKDERKFLQVCELSEITDGGLVEPKQAPKKRLVSIPDDILEKVFGDAFVVITEAGTYTRECSYGG
jgi:hypothetical protein